jgi:hypothetical protein
MALTVALRKLSIPRHRASYFWSAASLVVSDACHRTCVDRVPDDAVVEVPLEPEPV